METEEEKRTRYIASLEKHIDNAKEAAKYSSDRFDILLISLSTGSLLFSIGFAKDMVKDISKADTSYLKTAWLLFTVSLVSNLISQVTSYYSHQIDIKVSKNKIREKRGKEAKDNPKRTEWWCEALNHSTNALNAIGLAAFICGVVALVWFSSTNI
ncbi:MAG: hypothetical protein H6592_10430 [Flavobacteriales bacterium]|nr:hypothetical protein [Flavobacteriales bacterium]